MNRIEPLQLQRLIDGRLADREISDIVRGAEKHPEMWQQIGSAFVEDRVFRTAIGQFADESVATAPVAEVEKKSEPTAAPASYSRTPVGLAIAASLLLALTAGLAGGWYFGTQGASPVADVPADAVPEMAIADGDQLLNDSAQPDMNLVNDIRPDYHMQLQNADGREMLDSEVPLYTLKNAQRIGYTLDQNRVPEDMVTRAFDSGYGLNQRIHYISGTLSDGRKFIVPVRTVQLSSGH